MFKELGFLKNAKRSGASVPESEAVSKAEAKKNPKTTTPASSTAPSVPPSASTTTTKDKNKTKPNKDATQWFGGEKKSNPDRDYSSDLQGGGGIAGGGVPGLSDRGSDRSSGRGISKFLLAGGYSKGTKYSKTPEGARANEIYANKKQMTQSEYDRYNRQSGGEQIAHTYDSPMDQAKYEQVIQQLRSQAKSLGADAGYSKA